MGTGLPEDVERLRSQAYAHKVRAAYEKRRMHEQIAQLKRVCGELGIPVPSISPKPSHGPQGGRSDTSRPDHA